jgi:hypothetical protein
MDFVRGNKFFWRFDMNLRIAASAGLAAVVVLSVFTMTRVDSDVSADGAESNEYYSPAAVAQMEPSAFTQASILGGGQSAAALNSGLAESGDPQLEPIYVYPDGSIAPAPSSESGYQSEEYDDDHYEYDDDHDEYDEGHEYEGDHDDDEFFLAKLAGRLFSDDDDDHGDYDDHDEYDYEDHDDDDDHERGYDDD